MWNYQWPFIVKKSCYYGRIIDCNSVTKFWDFDINTFLGLRFLNGMMQGINTFIEFFKNSKYDLGILMTGQLSLMLLNILDGNPPMDKKCMLLYPHLSLSHSLLPQVALPAIIKHLFYHCDKTSFAKTIWDSLWFQVMQDL